MYSKIVNPVNGKKVNLQSKMGKQIIRNYMSYVNQLGGAESAVAAPGVGILIHDDQVVTVSNEGTFSTRNERSDAMVDSFNEAVLRSHLTSGGPISVEFFSAGTSIVPSALNEALLKKITEGKIIKVIIAGTELTAKQVILLGKSVNEAGAKFVYVSGGADQYEVYWGGRKREGNIKEIRPAGMDDADLPKPFCAESVPPASLFYAADLHSKDDQDAIDPELTEFIADQGVDIGAYVIHNGAPEELPALLDFLVEQRGAAKQFTIVHLVDRDDTTKLEGNVYSGLINSHAGIGGIRLADILVGGLDSGKSTHGPTLKWVES